MADSNEVWKPVVGFEGHYEVSDHGRVRSVDRVVTYGNRWGGGRPRFAPGRMLNLAKGNSHGHLAVRLSAPGRESRPYLVHRLVLEAFVGPAPEDKPLGLHWDDDPANNCLGNLRWGSRSDNMHDRVRNGGVKARARCKRGHEYTPENTYTYTDKRGQKRACRECARERKRAYQARLRQAQPGNGEGRAAA